MLQATNQGAHNLLRGASRAAHESDDSETRGGAESGRRCPAGTEAAGGDDRGGGGRYGAREGRHVQRAQRAADRWVNPEPSTLNPEP